MEPTTLSPNYPFHEPSSCCWSAAATTFPACPGVYAEANPPVTALSDLYSSPACNVFTASSPCSSTTATDITDIFHSHSPPCCEQQYNMLPIDISTYQHSMPCSSPPSSNNCSRNGKYTRTKRGQHGATNKPYRRTSSPVFPDGSVPISAITNKSSQHQYNRSSTLNGAILDTHSVTKAPLLVKLHSKYSNQFHELNKKLLKLHSEKAKLISLAKESFKLSSFKATTTPAKHQTIPSSDAYVSLSLIPTGYSEFDQGFHEEANILLQTIGGLYLSFETAVDNIISLCSSAQPSINSITDCFPYIQSLLHNSRLVLHENSTSKLIKLECPSNSEISQSLRVILEAINNVMEQAQYIQKHNTNINAMLTSYQEKTQFNIEYPNKLFSDATVDIRSHIHSILTANYTVLSIVEHLWQKHYQLATKTIANISESLTISSSTISK